MIHGLLNAVMVQAGRGQQRQAPHPDPTDLVGVHARVGLDEQTVIQVIRVRAEGVPEANGLAGVLV